MEENENRSSIFVGYADHTCGLSVDSGKRLTIGVGRDNSCNSGIETDKPYSISTYRYNSCNSGLNTSNPPYTVSTYRYDTCYTGDTSAHPTGRQFISNNLEDTLKVYDSDSTDKTLRFNGYQEDMDGKWYRVIDDGENIYYFEKD